MARLAFIGVFASRALVLLGFGFGLDLVFDFVFGIEFELVRTACAKVVIFNVSPMDRRGRGPLRLPLRAGPRHTFSVYLPRIKRDGIIVQVAMGEL